jgi:hypothetical protein
MGGGGGGFVIVLFLVLDPVTLRAVGVAGMGTTDWTRMEP